MLLTGLRTTVSPVAARLMMLLRILSYSPIKLQPRENRIAFAHILDPRAFQAAEGAVGIDRIHDELAKEGPFPVVDHREFHSLFDLLLRAQGNRRVSAAFVGLHVANHTFEVGSGGSGHTNRWANAAALHRTLRLGQIALGLSELLVEEAALAIGFFEALGEIGVGADQLGVGHPQLVVF